MEDTLRAGTPKVGKYFNVVLILVLMEDTLRGYTGIKKSSGRSLNPCFNGRYSQSLLKTWEIYSKDVLILVLMEDTLRE